MPNILIADDHDLVRDTIAAYLEASGEFRVLTASDLDGALEKMGGLDAIDLLILDYHMPGMNGLVGLERARKAFPATKVAMLSGVANRDVANKAMEKGADGFIPKSLTAASMVNAIRFVLAGERYFPFDFGTAGADAEKPAAFSDLSDREMQTEAAVSELAAEIAARGMELRRVDVPDGLGDAGTELMRAFNDFNTDRS